MQKKLDEIIKEIISPVFKLSGFKKQSRNWYKQLNDFGLCFNIQSSIYNDQLEIKFTFNSGIFHPEAYSIINETSIPDFPKE